jgi:hypothetical protein
MRALLGALLLVAAPKPSAWPLTASELEGESPNNNPRIDDSAPCSGKNPIELRLFARVKDGPQLRLTVKNCTGKAVKLLHDVDLQPSRVEFKAKLKAPFDERSRRKFDNTVRTRAFVSLEPGTERLLMDEKLKREGCRGMRCAGGRSLTRRFRWASSRSTRCSMRGSTRRSTTTAARV